MLQPQYYRRLKPSGAWIVRKELEWSLRYRVSTSHHNGLVEANNKHCRLTWRKRFHWVTVPLCDQAQCGIAMSIIYICFSQDNDCLLTKGPRHVRSGRMGEKCIKKVTVTLVSRHSKTIPHAIHSCSNTPVKKFGSLTTRLHNFTTFLWQPSERRACSAHAQQSNRGAAFGPDRAIPPPDRPRALLVWQLWPHAVPLGPDRSSIQRHLFSVWPPERRTSKTGNRGIQPSIVVHWRSATGTAA